MTIWGFPVVKLHAAVLVTSIEPVAFCHPFCPGCNVSVLPCPAKILYSWHKWFTEAWILRTPTWTFVHLFASSLPWFQLSIIFILLELMLSPQAFMYTGCYLCLQNSNCFPKINSHHHCAFYDAFPYLCIWPLLRASIFFPDLQGEFIKTETVSFFTFFFFNIIVISFQIFICHMSIFYRIPCSSKNHTVVKYWAFCTSIKWKLWM